MTQVDRGFCFSRMRLCARNAVVRGFFGVAGIILSFLLSGFVYADEARFVPGRILVKTKSTGQKAALAEKLKAYGAHRQKALEGLGVEVYQLAEDQVGPVLTTLRNDPDIEFVERDGVALAAALPDDPLVVSGQSWHLARTGVDSAWSFSAGSSEVVVAVLDSGCSVNHPDLLGRTLPAIDLIGAAADPEDVTGHGTSVSGVLCATGNNSRGTAGVAFGCPLLPIKVMDGSGFAPYSVIAEGIRIAVQRGAKVINISIVGSTPSSTLQQAVDYAWSNNVVIVAAAGNNTGTAPQYPAACDHVIAVSATSASEVLASFSSYGNHVSLAAPGEDIWTTQRDSNAPYKALRGSSLSSPIVAGVVALVRSANPSLSNKEVVELMQSTADDLGAPGRDSAYGFGRVNASRAVQAALVSRAGSAPACLPSVAVEASAARVPVGSVVSFSAAAWTGDRPATNVEFRCGDAVMTSLSAAPYATSWQAATEGRFEFRAVVNCGEVSSTSAPVVIDVVRADPGLPGGGVVTIAAKARFEGLFGTLENLRADNCGHLSLTLTPRGTFSGRVMLQGRRHGFSGKVSDNGQANVEIKRGTKSSLQLELQFQSTSGGVGLIGFVGDGSWRSGLDADRNVFDPRLNPAMQWGQRGFTLAGERVNAFNAAGVGKIAKSGATKTRGKLADRRKFANSGTLSASGEYPFYQSYDRGGEVIIGWLSFPAGDDSVEGTIYRVQNMSGAVPEPLAAAAAAP